MDRPRPPARFLASILPPLPGAVRGAMAPPEWWRAFLWGPGSFAACWIFAFTIVRLTLYRLPEGSYLAPAVALCLALLAGAAAFVAAWRAQWRQGAEPFRPAPAVPRRLLLVEDDDALLRGFTFFLGADGWDVVPARSMTEGLLRLYDRPQWLLTDMRLPDGSGVELVRAVRAAGFPVRVAVMSGLPEEDLREQLAGAAPDLVLTKGKIDVRSLSRRMMELAPGAG
jgi:CheY-like chemotaxis protein